MGHGRRSRSRSRSRDRKTKGSSGTRDVDRDSGKSHGSRSSRPTSSGGGERKARGHSRSRSRSRSRDRKGDPSSRRDYRGGRDRGGDRHHDDRKSRRSDRDGRDGDHRDRKRSRGSRRDRDGERADGNPDEAWKRKLADEEQQLKELDLDALMEDEEDEERRLEEQRRKRKEKLEALQKRKRAEEDQAKEAALEASATVSHDQGDQPQAPTGATNGHTKNASTNAKPVGGSGESSDPDDVDDASPIDISKLIGQSDGDVALAAQGAQDGSNEDDDTSGATNPMPIPGEEKQTNGATDKGGGLSSSELRAQQGKEDRPVFDMFSAMAVPTTAGAAGKRGGHGMSYLGDDGGGDQANWTDGEGYYKTRVGEVIGGRYTVLGSVGQGVFSTVLKCLDTRAGPVATGGGSEVALKMIRNNDTMRKAAQKEVALLKELAEHDPANKKHCIRLLCSLEHKQHVVMVFEAMQMNLRETLKKFGRKTGINIHAVQKYAKQLMAALKHMASRNLVHADIKPDNILVDQGFGSLKLADFGSAFRETDPDNDPTPYLVSRWYRAPEIVMGLDYDKSIDLWSVGVTLFELYKGAPVLPGVNNNEMLKRMMEFKGPVPTRMIKSHMRAFETMGGIRPHFTDGGQFMQQEPDPITGQTTVRLVTITAPSRPVKGEIMRSKGAQDKKETVADLADFLDKCMSLDPRQRISLEQCSAHSFLRRT